MDFSTLHKLLEGTQLSPLLDMTSDEFWHALNHGDLPRWQALLQSLPAVSARHLELKERVAIGHAEELDTTGLEQLRTALQTFVPWRKGPFTVFDIDVDTEWRSDMKWQRLLPHISSLKGRKVLDVGCGNGYHCFRMAGEGARFVIGIDPHLAYVMQFYLLRHFTPQLPVYVLPVSLEKFPLPMPVFDTVFSMGVLYHRRSPIDHLLELKSCLRKEGELVLETLVVDGEEGYALTPQGRYCRMTNVWFVPSVATTESWLRRCGFRNVRTVDVSSTTSSEQRKTSWMPFQSLEDGLNADHSLSIEGLPPPRRAIVLANAP